MRARYAVLHVPQVLALDEELNHFTLEEAMLPVRSELNLKPAQDRLPTGRTGNQAYELTAVHPKFEL